MRRTALVTGTVLAVLVSGCGASGGSGASTPDTAATPTGPAPEGDATRASPSPASPAPTTAAATGTPTAGQSPGPRGGASGWSVGRRTGRPSGSGLVLVDVRVRERERFDRIVLEMSGTGTPGWVVRYVDEAVLDGSGDVVDVGGRAVLDVYASGTTWPAPDYYSGPARLAVPAGAGIAGVRVGGTFEGVTQVLAGIEGGRVPFRVGVRHDPSRLVVDVAHGAARAGSAAAAD